MRNIRYPVFDAPEVYFLVIEGGLTLLTDARLPLGRVRENMAGDLSASKLGSALLPCIDFKKPYEGSCLHGRGWKLSVPKESDIARRGGIWAAAEFASMADWVEGCY